MKITRTLVLILLIISSNVYSQETDLKGIYTDVTTAINSALLTKSGVIEVSGFLSYNYLNTQYTNDHEWSQHLIQIEPNFSYFIADNISLGIDLSYLYQKTDFEESGTSATLEQLFIGPISKMYFGENRFRPFILADYLIMVGDSYEGGELDFGAGIFYHVAGNFGLSMFAKYGIIWSSKDIIDSQKRVFIGVGISNFIL